MSIPSTNAHDVIPRLSWPLAIARGLAALALFGAAAWLAA
jgi:hypothetical protein